MMLDKLIKIARGQRGFTVIEVIVSVAITGVLSVGATMATVQVMNQGSKNNEYTAASRQSMNAIFWISRDAQMSQNVTPSGVTGFPLTLGWTEWDNSGHQVTYSIEDDKIRRSYSVNGTTPKETVVGTYINSTSENTTCEFSDRLLTVQVTATVGDGAHALSVTKVREITPRPGL
jgi:prepilin-type N-terminal cleavage/methylation domain-containing protein